MLTIKLFKEEYGICRLKANARVPNWAKGKFISITRTSQEVSIVCKQENIPNNIKCEKNWCLFKICGPLDFSLIGILARLSGILAERNISIFAISTYDTDYILVKEKDCAETVASLKEEGYQVIIER